MVDLSYSYNNRWQVQNIWDFRDTNEDRSFAYDGQGQLSNASGPWGAGTFTYDSLGNIREKTLGTRTVSMNYDTATNRLSSYTDSAGPNKTLTYDARGNVTALGNVAFIYDMADQPRAATGGTYIYDGNLTPPPRGLPRVPAGRSQRG